MAQKLCLRRRKAGGGRAGTRGEKQKLTSRRGNDERLFREERKLIKVLSWSTNWNLATNELRQFGGKRDCSREREREQAF